MWQINGPPVLPLFGVKQPGPQPRRKHCLDPSKHCRVCTPFKLKHTTVAYAYYCSICTALQREHSIAENAHHPHICVLWSIICIPSLIGFQDVCPSMCLWQCCHLGWLWGWMRRQVGMGLGLAMGSAEWQWCCRGAKLHRGLAAWRDAHPWHGGMHVVVPSAVPSASTYLHGYRLQWSHPGPNPNPQRNRAERTCHLGARRRRRRAGSSL